MESGRRTFASSHVSVSTATLMAAAFAAALAAFTVLALAGCSGESGRSLPTQQQGVSSVMQQQMQSGSAADGGASSAEESAGAEGGEGGASTGAASASGAAAAAASASGSTFKPDETSAYAEVDVDLTTMGADMVYATVNDMLTYPTSYQGKVVRMAGPFYHSSNETYGEDYYFVVVQDATACCAQGLEFVWGNGERTWPADYPPENEEVVVTGVFETYTERTMNYIHLVNSSLELA